jgi:hypothetical protein
MRPLGRRRDGRLRVAFAFHPCGTLLDGGEIGPAGADVVAEDCRGRHQSRGGHYAPLDRFSR